MTKQELIDKGYNLIPISDLNIIYDPDKTVGYDMTVENDYTFSTYDGVFVQDTMAVYMPVSEEAQREAKNKMVTATGTSSINSMNFELSKEMLTGIMTITSVENSAPIKTITSVDEARKLHIGQKVSIKYKNATQTTTAGRVIFNASLPDWYQFVNEPVPKKKLNSILNDILSKSQNDFVQSVDNLMRISLYYATIYPKSFSLDMINLNPKIRQLKDQLSKTKSISDQSRLIHDIDKELLEHMRTNIPELYLQIASGSAKGGEQIRQIMVTKGIISDANGNILPPIIKSITEGYTPREYFNAAAGSRKGLIDKALNTGAGGYSYRKVLYTVSDVELNTSVRDCGTKRTLDIKLSPELYRKLGGRYVLDNRDRITKIDKDMIGQKIRLRSPIFCETKAICQICYGDLHKQLNTRNIGIVCAQEMNVSERIMKCSNGLIETKDMLKTFDDIWENTEWV
jgi:DNA-directed RNA polymerase beta' subunit